MKIDDTKLHHWVLRQRRWYKLGMYISPRRIALLESIPGWTWNTKEAAWEEGFRQLQKHGVVPARYVTKDGYNLGKWISHQRDGCTDPEKRKRLESIPGWTWDMLKDKFDEPYKILQKYGVQSTPYVTPEGFALGKWIQNMKTSYTRGRLNKYKIDKLEAVPGWKWARRYSTKKNKK